VGRHVAVRGTRLYFEERGAGYPVILLHGGPGWDHREFGDYLDPLSDAFRLILLDMRAQGRSDPAPQETWTVSEMALDLSALAEKLGLDRYAVLGHSFGALVALTHATEFPGAAAQTIVSHGVPSLRFYAGIRRELARLEPASVREQVAAAWEQLDNAQTPEDAIQPAQAQAPFHFRDPLDPRIDEFNRRTAGAVHAPAVMRQMSATGYGGFDVERRLRDIVQRVLVLTGRYERTCPVEAAELIARKIPDAELVVFENSAHMSFVEENAAYLTAVRTFLHRRTA
jgi:proline-specific peptidase